VSDRFDRGLTALIALGKKRTVRRDPIELVLQNIATRGR
jgi:hypothetical protein